HTIGLELKARRLVVLPVRGLPEMRRWYLVHRAQKRLSPTARAFHAFLVENGQTMVENAVGVAPDGAVARDEP
ncbi:MAG: LysR substrate-binding domain-containing protein, partial [Gammaproteobacteria bacterium]